MAGEWQNLQWGQIASLEYGRALREYQGGGYRVYGTNGPIGWHAQPLCDQPGVIVGRKGAYRGIHFSAEPFFVIDTAFYLKPKVPMDPRWAYYCLLTYDINGMDSGSAIPSTSRDAFHRLAVRFPPLPEQRAIAAILGTLDDKIELNRCMAETLEAIARALFHSWFVAFDPVRAKAQGRDPGLPEHLAALFPISLEPSIQGSLPFGWRAAMLSDVCEFNPHRSLRRSELAPYLPMASVPTVGHSPSEIAERPFGSGMCFSNGDTLLARITPCLENGKTAFVDFLRDGEVGWGSTEFIVLRPKPPLPDHYAYCLARSQDFRHFAIQQMTGTTGRQRVPTASLAPYRVAVPPAPIASAFGRQVAPAFDRSAQLHRANRTLAALRDLLLKKLISGQLRVPAAERAVSAVT